ncbi:hypothetical protein PQQ51_33560, partial [Paraburkholderia xenovorans]|uniref:hypothetical protein n=1 Tax=Paraburkholderia xenovorans TaxID=36873 RepID=UPI0038BD6C3B
VKFPVNNSELSDFSRVSTTTSHRERGSKRAPITDAMTDNITPAAHSFNERALKAQKQFAASVLAGSSSETSNTGRKRP